MTSSGKPQRKPAITRENIELSEKVLAWATIQGISNSERVLELVSDLVERKNWAYWSSRMASEILPSIPLKRSKVLRHWYRRVIFLRNLLVFLPVTITWIAISESSSAFSQYINANEGSVINFLEFWQDGYGYLSPIWRLSTVALIDFLILAFIMLLTISLQFLSSRADQVEREELSEQAKSREQLSKELFEFFSRNQKVTPLTMDRTLATALRDLSKTTSNLERLTKELGKSVKGFPSYLSVIKEVKSLSKSVDRLKRQSDGSDTSI